MKATKSHTTPQRKRGPTICEMKARMRKRDAARLKSGTVLRRQLQEENSVVPMDAERIDIVQFGF